MIFFILRATSLLSTFIRKLRKGLLK